MSTKRKSGVAAARKHSHARYHYKLVGFSASGDLCNLTEQQLHEFEVRYPHIAERWLDNGSTAEPSKWEDRCMRLLSTLTAMKQAAKWFLEPVDPVALGLQLYFQVIKDPMDLGALCSPFATYAFARACLSYFC